jgi:L-amino acid N-acyltransferase YncA
MKNVIQKLRIKDITSIVTTIITGNQASTRLFKKLGFEFDSDEVDENNKVFESNYILKI